MADRDPQDAEILELVGTGVNPDNLIATLSEKYPMDNVIEGLQRAIEREKITLDRAGMVVAVRQLAEAA
ncbi:hypothetical protein [Hephaestia mangrovi]|uniref:hypothetical protein n=1 Tax=Hephaestia mangrovi TaxID=2873268 RepID=UPI001CA64226|nr:hypothetical protein [Hephaestia mangrovi]MBY8828536.1 hypothetical protein [Hephaestia mangrovi]